MFSEFLKQLSVFPDIMMLPKQFQDHPEPGNGEIFYRRFRKHFTKKICV